MPGALCVMTSGVLLMEILFADSLAMEQVATVYTIVACCMDNIDLCRCIYFSVFSLSL